ncbi:MAG: tRNA 2-thiouridine(34) synthase MnmA, partial [Acidobacteria bacterium]|nr:tRNA 2-thiouridine(34) synthase MnmA [Acidobacteriota bacterium]
MKIIVALSGGVDSAVAASRLVRDGHEVVAVTMRLADLASCGLGSSRCCSPGDVEVAARTAWALGIRHEVVDLGAEFRREVLEPFVESYLAGETPSPCVRCNSRVKFGAILAGMEKFDADSLATGHYARVEHGPDGSILRRGVDAAKDQAYFLWELAPEQLRRVCFPLGGSLKSAVRAEARALDLPSAGKADSQEICFVPPGG